MTPLGVGPEHCHEALESYREGVAALAAMLRGPQVNGPGNATLAAFDDLVNRFEVDARARTGPIGSARMSQVEAQLFAPAVTTIHHDLESLARQRPAPHWLPALQAIDRKLLAAEHDLERWRRDAVLD
jgi:hypothetical protein